MSGETAGTPRVNAAENLSFRERGEKIRQLDQEVAALTTQRDEAKSLAAQKWNANEQDADYLKSWQYNWSVAIKERDQWKKQADGMKAELSELRADVEAANILEKAINEANERILLRAEAAEAQRDELQKRIGYTAVPHDSQCESPPEVD